MALEILQITDEQTGSIARITPGFGFNCFSFQAPLNGQLSETLWAHPEFTSGSQRPSGSGIPLLFPFAGRIPGTSFEYQGKKYELTAGDNQGNAIHGFVMNRPWRVAQESTSSVTGEFQASIDEPDLSRSWPADFKIQITYTVSGSSLLSKIKVENPGESPLPFAFATHAYFRLPVGGKGESDTTIVKVPVSDAWELSGLIPTGKKIGMGELGSLASGMPLGDHVFDNVFTNVKYEGGRAVTSVHNPAGPTLMQTFDDTFQHVVVYTPPHREAICMEPYTAIPNALALEEQGVETGLRWLKQGEAYETEIVITLS